MKALYDQISATCVKNITRSYSTSFSLGIKALAKEIHHPIYAIYGFVRLADEIVDTFHDFPKKELLERFEEDTYKAIKEKISLNPVLNSFQCAVNTYQIPLELIDTFLKSMYMDLERVEHNKASFKEYIVGSAEVVGLMCLKVFCNGDAVTYEKLKPNAMSLGSAFQKINFLRDLNADYKELGRSYFPGVEVEELDTEMKKKIEADIQIDFENGLAGIKQLPNSSRFGVYLAYVYYLALFKKIQNVHPGMILQARIRVSNYRKSWLLLQSLFKYHLNLI